MKTSKYLAILMAMLLIIAGCSNGAEKPQTEAVAQPKGIKIIVEQRVGEENKYEHFKEITDAAVIQSVKDILDGADWIKAKVEMSQPPHYQFRYGYINEQAETNFLYYDLWISPHKDQLELIQYSKHEYTQLNPQASATLFKLLTDQELSDQ